MAGPEKRLPRSSERAPRVRPEAPTRRIHFRCFDVRFPSMFVFEASTTAQEASMIAPGRPKRTTHGFLSDPQTQEASKRAKTVFKIAHDGSKRVAQARKKLSEGPRRTSQRPPTG
eukprot:9493495-Pyramimonas_sp.AAC.1